MSKQRFTDKTLEALTLAARQVADDVPEVEAVMFVVLWRFDDQRGLPSAKVVGADGPIVNPDQLLRAQLAVAELQRFLVQRGAEGVMALRELAANLARTSHDARKDPQAGAGTQRTQAPSEASVADGPTHDDRPQLDPSAR